MRLNLPVTQHEYPFPSGETLVSVTDLESRITYCNPAFIAVSGYTRDELLGQYHNLIRHPGMPEEAFRDMWETIKGGRPWSALVMNRRKNGDHYWVKANVTPLVDGAETIGYMSVRTEASHDQIESAEALYAVMRRERESGRPLHRLHRGQVELNNLRGRLARAFRIGEVAKIRLALVLAALTGVAAANISGRDMAMSHVWAGIGLLIVLAGLGWLVASRTSAAQSNLVEHANRLAAGDLRFSLDESQGMSELARALGQLGVNLQAVVRDARTQAGQLMDATSEIASGNLDLSKRTEAQASSLEQTAASMEQITATVKNSVQAVESASQLTAQATQVAGASSEAMSQVADTMKQVREASQRISDITHVIDSIAFQTNILALNASVEAARAGEQGRGFAVVAGEVRTLSQRTSTAAKEIKQLIETAAARIESGYGQSESASQKMADSLIAVKRVDGLVREVSHASKEQLDAISQVNAAISHMDQITQQNAALVEEMAATAASVRAQAEVLTATVGVFRIRGAA